MHEGGSQDAFTAEAMSCREALTWLKAHGFTKVKVETNCLLLTTAISSSTHHLSAVGLVIEDCKRQLGEIPECTTSFIRRSANSVAHTLAMAARSPTDCGLWVDSNTPFLSSILLEDMH